MFAQRYNTPDIKVLLMKYRYLYLIPSHLVNTEIIHWIVASASEGAQASHNIGIINTKAHPFQASKPVHAHPDNVASFPNARRYLIPSQVSIPKSTNTHPKAHSSPFSNLAFFPVPTSSVSSAKSTFLFPLPLTWLVPLSTGFFLLTRLVKSVAPFDAFSNRTFCAAGVSPRMEPRTPLRGLEPSRVPRPVGSATETGGWRSSRTWGMVSGYL